MDRYEQNENKNNASSILISYTPHSGISTLYCDSIGERINIYDRDIHGKCQGRATLLGRTGTYVEAFSATFQANGVVVGHASLGDGTGGLIGMHGVQSNSSSPDGKATFYSAQVHFEES